MWRVYISFVVGFLVVFSVMGGPPQRSPLSCRTRGGSKQKLHGTTCLKRSMREVPVKKSRYGEHPCKI